MNNPVTAPWVATARTILQNVVGVALALVGAYLAFSALAPELLAAVADVLPPNVTLWLTGFVASTAAISGAIARIMAIPAVNAWLNRYRVTTNFAYDVTQKELETGN